MVQETISPKNKNKTSHKLTATKVLCAVIVLLILAFGASTWQVYRWQHKQVENLKSNLKDTETKADKSKKALIDEITANAEVYSNLQKKYLETQEALDKQNTAPIQSLPAHTPTQEDLDLTVLKAVTVNWDNTGTTFGGVAINLTLKNSTDTAIVMNPWNNDFKLKDADNHVYTMMFSLGSGLGKDFVALQGNAIAPGESITGYIGIQVPDTNVLNYTLIIGGHTYKVTATKLEGFPITD